MVNKIYMLIFLLLIAGWEVSAAEVKIIPGKFGKPIGLEFIDDRGVVEKTIREGRASGELETTITTAGNNFLVTVSQQRKVSDKEYKKTGIPYDVRNKLTVYNRRGHVVFELPNAPCKPTVLSHDAEKFLCYYQPVDDPDGEPYADFVDEEKKVAGLYIYERKGVRWKQTRFRGVGEKAGALMSPNGKWMALHGSEYSPNYTDLLYMYSLKKPLSYTPIKTLKGTDTKNASMIGNNGEIKIDIYEVVINEQNEPEKKIIKTKILYQP